MADDKSFDADYAVVGLGSMGSFAFWQLAKRNKRVIGFEQYTPGHDQGAGHGETRIFRTAYGEGVEYVPLLQQARSLWQEFQTEAGIEIYTENKGTMFGPIGDAFIETVEESVHTYKLPHKKFSAEEAKQAYPQIKFKDNHKIICEEYAGFVRPELAIETAVKQGVKLGGTAYTEHPVTAIETDENGVLISVNEKQFRVKKVIVSAGGWTNSLLPQLNLPLELERQVLVWYDAKKPELFTQDKFPIFSRVVNGEGFYGFPTLDGKTVKVAIHHGGGDIIHHPNEVEREIHQRDLDKVTELVKEYFPDLKPEPVKAKTCFYTNTPDEHFIIGEAPSLSNVILLGPMAGHGFKFAPVIGKIGADLALEETSDLDIAIFDPNRFNK
ncbi:N-methyl-L-tryptophan oxidase [Oceanobacillus sp. FSL H7-0719]|uniref:N-methyl-L-tryptophan oxidase n=1 Tax=Oceanobacillus sp. FSL H7-0719 TaxID=2954507 RepID=UPI00324FF528